MAEIRLVIEIRNWYDMVLQKGERGVCGLTELVADSAVVVHYPGAAMALNLHEPVMEMFHPIQVTVAHFQSLLLRNE